MSTIANDFGSLPFSHPSYKIVSNLVDDDIRADHNQIEHIVHKSLCG